MSTRANTRQPVAPPTSILIAMVNKLSHYFKVLADTSNIGNMDLWLAEHHFCHHRWSLARKHIERSLAKGGVDDPDHARELRRQIHKSLGQISTPSQP